jgi:pSer/pThr/pTyr-binding forkhead associated (FHA) protein
LSQQQAGQYVLKFISGKYQGGEFPLEQGSEILIGRSSELDMVLVEDMVSRKHARISAQNGALEIEDFGSTNGTFVNGEKITKSRLKEGDRVLIGTNIIKLVHRDQVEQDGGSPGMSAPNTMQQAGPANRTTGATLTGSISGLIEEVPLPDLLQLFSTSRKSGVLVIRTEIDTAKIYLREGRVVYATINDDPEISPHKAFYRVLAWRTGTFSLEQPTDDTFDDEMDDSIENLLMEGMRQLDEIMNLGDDVPELTSDLTINQPLVPPLRSLTPELLDTIQLVLNYGSVSKVLNKSLASDLETMQDVVYLIRNDYMHVD